MELRLLLMILKPKRILQKTINKLTFKQLE